MSWERIRAWARYGPRLRPWLGYIVALVVIVLLALAWNRAHRLATALGKEREAEALRARDLIVEHAAKRADLETRAKALAGQNADLAAELARARASAPRARVTGTFQGSTKPAPAAGTPTPTPTCATPGSGGAAAPPAQPTQGVPAGAGCLLAVGDLGEIHVEQVELTTKAGNRVVVGAAGCYRSEVPPVRLFGGAFSSALSTATGEAERPAPRWGVGLMAAASRDSVGAGPVVMFPPLRLWGLQGEALAGCAAGSGGLTACIAAAGVRW